MTQYRKDCCVQCGAKLPEAELTNYFDRLFRGIGHRRSSFSDLDFFAGKLRLRVTHDGQTHRFLAFEFKYARQLPLDGGQMWLLHDLALVAEFTVWLLIKRPDGLIGWLNCQRLNPGDDSYLKQIRSITEHQCQTLFRRWWNRDRMELAAEEAMFSAMPMVDEIFK